MSFTTPTWIPPTFRSARERTAAMAENCRIWRVREFVNKKLLRVAGTAQ